MGYYLQHKWSLWTYSQQLLKETSANFILTKKKKGVHVSPVLLILHRFLQISGS